jgi:hypothetical protein
MAGSLGRCDHRPADYSNAGAPGMKALLLLLLIATIAMVAYLAVPARPVAEAEAGKS